MMRWMCSFVFLGQLSTVIMFWVNELTAYIITLLTFLRLGSTRERFVLPGLYYIYLNYQMELIGVGDYIVRS